MCNLNSGFDIKKSHLRGGERSVKVNKKNGALHNYFKNPGNLISTAFGILVTFATLLLRKTKIPMWILGVLVISVLLLFMYYQFKLASLEDELAFSKEMPQSITPISWYNHQDYGNILIIDSYSFLHRDAFVTIYVSNEVEEYFATGVILCEQTSKGKLMVRILKSSCLEKLPTPEELRLKPIITNRFLKEEQQ